MALIAAVIAYKPMACGHFHLNMHTQCSEPGT